MQYRQLKNYKMNPFLLQLNFTSFSLLFASILYILTEICLYVMYIGYNLGYNMSAADRANDEASARTYHRIVEAFKHGYAARAYLGDPGYANISEVR